MAHLILGVKTLSFTSAFATMSYHNLGTVKAHFEVWRIHGHDTSQTLFVSLAKVVIKAQWKIQGLSLVFCQLRSLGLHL